MLEFWQGLSDQPSLEHLTLACLSMLNYLLPSTELFVPQELETKQQRSVHGLREQQLTTQHRTELGNQVKCSLLCTG